MLSCEKKILPFFIERYDKTYKSKIQMVCDIAKELPTSFGKAYALCDSWFTCEKVVNAHFAKGYHLIGGLKTNRNIFPKGIKISVSKFAKYIEKNDVCLVTVNHSRYYVYRYEGNLKGIDNAIVLFCWPEKAFKKPGALRAFLCTDTELNTGTILEYYSKRWPIETFFRNTKNNLGLKGYQVRSEKAIDRIMVLIALTYIYCASIEGANNNFNIGLKLERERLNESNIQWIYNCAKENIPFEYVLKRLKPTA